MAGLKYDKPMVSDLGGSHPARGNPGCESGAPEDAFCEGGSTGNSNPLFAYCTTVGGEPEPAEALRGRIDSRLGLRIRSNGKVVGQVEPAVKSGGTRE